MVRDHLHLCLLSTRQKVAEEPSTGASRELGMGDITAEPGRPFAFPAVGVHPAPTGESELGAKQIVAG